jgi:hypothetical protein
VHAALHKRLVGVHYQSTLVEFVSRVVTGDTALLKDRRDFLRKRDFFFSPQAQRTAVTARATTERSTAFVISFALLPVKVVRWTKYFFES